MAIVRPFRGLRFNPKKIADLASVMSLPYDVLTDRDREELYQAHPCNIIRIIWGKDLPGDGPQENKYLRAGRLLKEWEAEEILIQEVRESFYLYAQDFPMEKEMKSRQGIIARVKLGNKDSDAILRHENTFLEQRTDRLDLIRATAANLDPIFALYEGKGTSLEAAMKEETGRSPLLDIRDRWGVRQRLWAIQDTDQHRLIMQEMAQRRLFIADGHHRFDAAFQYRRERMAGEKEGPKMDPGYHYTLMTLVAMEDPGLIVLPYHRLLREVRGWDLQKFLPQARGVFSVEEVALPSQGEEREAFVRQQLEKEDHPAHRFALYAGGDSLFLLTRTRSEAPPQLDVAILEEVILQGLLGLQGPDKEGKINYTHDMKEALGQVEGGAADLAFLLRPTSLEEIQYVSLAGEKMPQKSTYFYPKLLSGLVINPLDP